MNNDEKLLTTNSAPHPTVADVFYFTQNDDACCYDMFNQNEVLVGAVYDINTLNTLVGSRLPATPLTPSEIDEAALVASREIMLIVEGSWLPGGSVQVQAKIQCALIELVKRTTKEK